MKIAITGDFHFGFNDDATLQARRALADAKGKADFVIAAGDLFDYRVPKQEAVHDSVRIFNECKSFGDGSATVEVADGDKRHAVQTAVVAIYGTHERRTKGLVNIVELLHEAGLLVNCHARKVYVTKTKARKPECVCIQGMGGIPEELAKNALKLMDFKPEPGCFNIFVFHQSLSELIPADTDMLSMRDLPAGFDLYVDGHIHWRHDMAEGGKHLLIPGSTVVTQMKKNEAGPKGYFIYDTERRAAEFVTFPTRPFYFEEVVLSEAGLADAVSAIRAKLDAVASKETGVAEPLVKIKVTGTLARGLGAGNLDTTQLQAEYGSRMVLSIDKQVGSLDLKEKIDLLRRMRGERKGAREIGLEILKRKLQENGASAQLPGGSAEELFDLLCDGEVDAALERLIA